jgi:hypothetical protein
MIYRADPSMSTIDINRKEKEKKKPFSTREVYVPAYSYKNADGEVQRNRLVIRR